MQVLEAKARGMDREEDFLAYECNEYAKILVRFAHKRDVLEEIEILEREIQKQCEAEKEQYRLSAMTRATEILVGTEEQARDLPAQIRAGVEMVRLAQQHRYSDRVQWHDERIAELGTRWGS